MKNTRLGCFFYREWLECQHPFSGHIMQVTAVWSGRFTGNEYHCAEKNREGELSLINCIKEKSRRFNIDKFQRPPFWADIRSITQNIGDNILFAVHYPIRAAERIAPAVALVAG